MFARIESYYRDTGLQLGLGTAPERANGHDGAPSIVIVPIVDVSHLPVLALSAAYRMGGQVVPLAVDRDPDATRRLSASWKARGPGVELRVLPSPHRSLVPPILGYVRQNLNSGHHVTVLLAEVEPRKHRYQILHNQRGLIHAAALRTRTDAVVATLPLRIH